MKNQNKEVIGFTFQEIPLEEALNVVLAGNGDYSELKQALLSKLPALAPDKAFAFGLPNGKEIEEDHRRGLCMAINATLKRAMLDWSITYSGIKKVFICLPKVRKMQREKNTNHKEPLPINTTALSLVDLAKRTLNYQGNFRNKENETRIIRKVISYIGVNDLGLKKKELAPLIGITKNGVYFNACKANPEVGAIEIDKVRKALRGKIK